MRREPAPVVPRGRFLVGAAIGTGMAAKSAEQGGADFLLALNAGRFRSMGAPSAACLLALRNSNQLVMEFGQNEILTQTSLPVFFGATPIGIDIESLLDQIAEGGFHGVANFPSCTFLDGQYRRFLEESGHGFDRELALLEAARARGLTTLAYVHTVAEARRVAAHVDMVNLDFGWNMGGSVGVESPLDIEESSALAAEFVTAVRDIRERTRCLIEGGPIVTPEHMDRVCGSAKADGYIGGSTIDRVPLESAIEMATSAFKTVGSLRQQVEVLEKRLQGKAPIDAIIGFSDSMARAREQVARAMELDWPVLIVGEAGSGRRELAKAIHEARAPQGRWVVSADCGSSAGGKIEINLFGGAQSPMPGNVPQAGLLEVARGSTLVIDEVGNLDIAVQRQLLQAARTGGFSPRGGSEVTPLEVRFIGISSVDLVAEIEQGRVDGQFLQWLSAIRIELPPLREHLEDLPMLAEAILRRLPAGSQNKLSASAYRALLGYPWPGNVGELRSVIQAAAAKTRGGIIGEETLAALLKGRPARSDRKAFSSEREWILDGLKRNRFRRAETAQFLRVSRKTLYNKIRQHGLMSKDLRLRKSGRSGGSELPNAPTETSDFPTET
jgi:predicted TIM-barrel enzyme/DNA-binding NtrC family response regulator